MLHIFYGPVNDLIKEETSKLLDQNNYTKENIIYYDLEEKNISSLLFDAKMPSLFNDKKVLIGQNAIFLTGQKSKIEHSIDDLIKLIGKNIGDTLIVLTVNTEKLDKRKKVVKELEKENIITFIPELQGTKLVNHITEFFKTKNLQIDNSEANYLIKKLHGKYNLLKNKCKGLYFKKK